MQTTESAEDLFRIDRLMNSTFRLTIKEQCLQLPSLELYLVAFDVSIGEQVGIKEIDQLDQSKLNMIRINRQMRKFGRNELSNFKQDSKFKLAVVFFDHTGVVDLVVQQKEFSCNHFTRLSIIFY